MSVDCKTGLAAAARKLDFKGWLRSEHFAELERVGKMRGLTYDGYGGFRLWTRNGQCGLSRIDQGWSLFSGYEVVPAPGCSCAPSGKTIADDAQVTYLEPN